MQWGAIYLAGAVAVAALLIVMALYVPENYLLRSSASSGLQNWLPPRSELPPGLVLVERYKTSNQDIARGYAEPQSMLEQLNAWGRLEGYIEAYLAQARCTHTHPRRVHWGIVQLNDAEGARQYLEWSQARDQEQADAIQAVELGDGGYMMQREGTSACSPDEVERVVEIFFNHANRQGYVLVAASTQYATDEQAALVLRLAGLVEQHLLQR